ncbi:hypothetical protein GKE82_20695 [Conexibacter sp. W3-3-2]|uniref:Uncharacterized protein n=1 Tax=Paraconexibacter algicola TaxID=2133960 RepID=A0A2T4UMD2_9ACTN|nr:MULTISPECIES: hypothetical protein [Solirubrobacterales]MTD46642.1 hypothetical protein [Conexibacter sp. W3-3-2]PTL60361.1 hypothetical protein C7Y72_12290 [Paraconexibacter algicola]
MPLVAQHRFVAILRARGWRAPLIGTWTPDGRGVARGPAGATCAYGAPPDSDDRNEKGTWSSVWVAAPALQHADVAMAVEVAGLGDDVLDGPLGPQGRYRRRGLEILLRRVGLEGRAQVADRHLLVAGYRVHLGSGAVRAPDGRLRPRDADLAPLAVTDDPGLGRILAQAVRLADADV